MNIIQVILASVEYKAIILDLPRSDRKAVTTTPEFEGWDL